ncbi:MAG: hypothetical protein ABGW78_07400 [Pirellulales bacterium]
MRCYENRNGWVCWSFVGIVCAIMFGVIPCMAADVPLKAGSPHFDRSAVYRYDLVNETFSLIQIDKLKPLHVYYRFSPILDRWVWSKVDDNGEKLEFAIGPGSIQRANLFDLTISIEEGLEVLEQRAPDIARLYIIQGSSASMVLGEDGKWELNGVISVGHILDLETSQRWEWHGDHRVEVIHSGGNYWQYERGKFVPLWSDYRFAGCCP